jgi:hypothetical protein
MSPPTLVKVAQLQKFAFSGMSATLEDITNLDSPTAFKEVLPTVIDPKDITFDGICDPSNSAWANLATRLQGRTLTHWEIVLTNGTTITFDGYVTDASGHMRDQSALFEDVANKFSTMKDGAEKTALAQQIPVGFLVESVIEGSAKTGLVSRFESGTSEVWVEAVDKGKFKGTRA